MKACNACGKCCVKYGNGQLTASPEDIALWDSFRPEVAAYVKDGNIWFDPHSGQQLTICPWLKPVDNKSQVFHCQIYFDRPEDCRVYPTNINDMIKDDCEMLEPHDLSDLDLARQKLAQINIVDN